MEESDGVCSTQTTAGSDTQNNPVLVQMEEEERTRVPGCTWQWMIAEATSLLNPLTHSSCVVPRHEFICLSFQRSASGLECQPLFLDQVQSSCLFLFQHSAQSGRDKIFQNFFFSKRWFVVTLGLVRGDQLKMSRFCRPLCRDTLIGRWSRIYKWMTLTEPVHLPQESTNNLTYYYVLQNATRYVIPEDFAKSRFQLYLQNATLCL